jgi:hypothetical protein
VTVVGITLAELTSWGKIGLNCRLVDVYDVNQDQGQSCRRGSSNHMVHKWPLSPAIVHPTSKDDDTDRMLLFAAQHLRTILAQYEAPYNGRRPHRSRQLRPLVPITLSPISLRCGSSADECLAASSRK